MVSLGVEVRERGPEGLWGARGLTCTQSPVFGLPPLAKETDGRITSFMHLSFSVKTVQKIKFSQIYWELTAKSFLVYDKKSSCSVLLRGLFPLSSSSLLAAVSALSLVYS